MQEADQRMFDRFVRLCEIASPTGEERAVADAVLAELRDLGVEVEEDGSAGPARAAAGNLIARVAGTGEGWLSFFSHLDTVPHEGPIEVSAEDGVFRSKGDTILGADNKAAVTTLIELAARHTIEPPPVGLELIFTVAEEDGLRGAKELDISRLRAPFGFVLDHATPIGEVIVAAPTHKRLIASFAGHEAHAGINPEDGRSAIVAAARAISDLRLGRIDEETTANAGLIEGGSALNVVPDRCRLAVEARSRDDRKLAALVQELLDSFAFAAAVSECEVETTVVDKYRGYRLADDDPALALARRSLERAGFEPKEVEVGGGADANVFNERGLHCVNVANGMANVHTADEQIAVADLEAMVGVTLELVSAAREA